LAASSPKRIAIVCATRNAAATLASMLDSYLAERTAETELVIVDSCSTDNTPAILSRYESCIDRLIVESDRSIYEAWNKGVAASSADYVCFIGADDRLASGVVKTLLQLIEDYPTADYIHGCNVMCRNGRPVGIIGREYDDSTMLCLRTGGTGSSIMEGSTRVTNPLGITIIFFGFGTIFGSSGTIRFLPMLRMPASAGGVCYL
jgi:glycosyltransferase involved in cell wall biosynthesis